MKRKVIWLNTAAKQLGQFFVPLWGTPEGRIVTAAVARIEHCLATDPENSGESREGSDRILIDLPISVDFEIVEDSDVVIVTSVRYHPPKK